MKCPNCEKEFTSEKIYGIHIQKCVAEKQDDQSLDDTKVRKQKEEKTTRKKPTPKRDAE
jgi:uncharacterized C2H2 Zn-finger protein